MTLFAPLRACAFILFGTPLLAGCQTMSQAELEQCAAAGHAYAEKRSGYEYGVRLSEIENQSDVRISGSFGPTLKGAFWRRMSMSARQKIVARSSDISSVCIDCSGRKYSRISNFGYTTDEVEKRIGNKVDELKRIDEEQLEAIYQSCGDKIPRSNVKEGIK